MERINKCDICIYRAESKDATPCAICTDNKVFTSRFKEDPIVGVLRRAWDIKDNYVNNSDPEGETAWTATKS